MTIQNIREKIAEKSNYLKFAIIFHLVIAAFITLGLTKTSHTMVVERSGTTAVSPFTGNPSLTVGQVGSFRRQVSPPGSNSEISPNKATMSKNMFKTRFKEQY